MNPDQNYRPNVGMMLVNSRHQILAGEAIHCPGEWMMPQGGIDLGENPQQAMQRELAEETSIRFETIELLKEHDGWISYLFRKPLVKDGQLYVGQRQRWFLLAYDGDIPNAETTEDREFSRFNWVEPAWLIDHATTFKVEVYETIFRDFEPYLP